MAISFENVISRKSVLTEYYCRQLKFIADDQILMKVGG